MRTELEEAREFLDELWEHRRRRGCPNGLINAGAGSLSVTRSATAQIIAPRDFLFILNSIRQAAAFERERDCALK
jgi:hypothetical protein